MKKLISMMVFLIFLLVVSVGVMAQTKKVNVRQKTQQARIAEGRASGELTKKETRMLKAEQRHIRRSKKRAKSDGEVTPEEKVKLERKQNRANRHIRRQKHDEQSREDN